MRSVGVVFITAAWVVACSGCAGSARSKDPAYVPAGSTDPAYTFELAGSFIVPSPKPGATGPQFNGISALAALRDGHEMLALSDDRDDSRVFRIAVEWTGSRTVVKPLKTILLQRGSGAPELLDPEGIVVTRDGHMLVSSEGVGNQEPRLPPSLIEYSPEGRFVRLLPVRPRYVPNERGPLATGVRGNAAFEALAITQDFSKIYTASELPLVQDGPDDPFGPVRTRVLEYVAAGNSYRPGREFVYELTPLEPVAYERRFAVNGLVEIVALGNGELLVMERGFVESADRKQATNRIRLFRVSFDGATDVSARESLAGAAVTPMKKTLVLDLNTVPGLDPKLAGLDNFEGMAWGPALTPGGRRPLVLVSDDNESPRQVTAFLVFKR